MTRISGRTRADRHAVMEALTPREAEVLTALMRGWSVPDIARHGVVSVATVRSQLRSILSTADRRTALGTLRRPPLPRGSRAARP